MPNLQPSTKSPRRKTLKEHVYLNLKERILSGRLKVGTSLIETDIAKELGVSRTPIREAILQLERDALVEVLPNRGAYVTFISLKDLKDSIQVLQILEGAAARLSVDRIDLNELKKIETEFYSLQKKGATTTYEEEQNVGIQMHELILQAAGNFKLISVSHGIREQIRTLSQASIKAPGRVLEAIKEHLAIIAAIKIGDGSEAEKAMHDHLDSVYQTLTKLID